MTSTAKTYYPIYFQSSATDTTTDAFRLQLWNFVHAQIQDGMITTDALAQKCMNPSTQKEEDVFFCYLHQMCNYDNKGLCSNGTTDSSVLEAANWADNLVAVDSAATWDYRARGLIAVVFKNDFLNQENDFGFIADSAKQYGVNYVSYITQQQLANPGTTGDVSLEDVVGWSGTVAPGEVTGDEKKRYSIGWSASCLAPFNYMSMLVSYAPDDINFSQSMAGDDSSSGRTAWQYQPEVFLGADAPNLSYNAENGRFAFCSLHTCQQQYNEFDAGESSPAIDLNNTIDQPLIDVQSNMTYGIPVCGGDPSDDSNLGSEKSIQTNVNAGNPCVFINYDEWRLLDRSLYQLAPNWTKVSRMYNVGWYWYHESDGTPDPVTDDSTYLWNRRSPIFSVMSTGSGNKQTEVGIEGDKTMRSYCITEDVRYNTWDSVFGGESNQNDFIYQPVINSWKQGTYPKKNTYIPQGIEVSLPSGFWTSLQGDSGFTERTNAEGNIRPNPSIIYDTIGGVWISAFSTNIKNEAGFSNSLFAKLGYTYEDLFPAMVQNGREYRNVVLDSTIDAYEGVSAVPIGCSPTSNNDTAEVSMGTFGRSIPYTTDEILGDYIDVTTNVLGEKAPQISIPNLWKTNPSGITNATRRGTGVATGLNPNYHTASVTPTNNPRLLFNASGGGSRRNNQYVRNRLAMNQVLEDSKNGTRLYASNFPLKVAISFYTIRSSLVNNDPLYTNNAQTYATLPVLGLVLPSYASGDVFYTQDVGMKYTATSNYKVSELHTGIFDNEGNPADLSVFSTIIYKIVRASGADPRVADDGKTAEEVIEESKAKLATYKAQIKSLM